VYRERTAVVRRLVHAFVIMCLLQRAVGKLRLKSVDCMHAMIKRQKNGKRENERGSGEIKKNKRRDWGSSTAWRFLPSRDDLDWLERQFRYAYLASPAHGLLCLRGHTVFRSELSDNPLRKQELFKLSIGERVG